MKIKKIEIGENLFGKNDEIARENSELLRKYNILSLNLMGSPGSGKTSILELTIRKLKEKNITCGVIEGDIAGTFDSERISFLEVPVVQINTGGACHLEAMMIKKGMEQLTLNEIKVLFVENVGNLVCPAEFKLGIKYNVTVASITEGEEKPLKYPLMYSVSQLVLLNKIDLLKAIDFDTEKFFQYAKKTNPDIKIIPVSGKTGDNINQFVDFIEEQLLIQ
jgi:hydrogenase nickel incorporation protein HypB